MSEAMGGTTTKTSLFATCAVKALVVCDNKFLVLSKLKWAKETGIIWNDLPGGRIENGEISPTEALCRELKEEIGSNGISIKNPIHMTTVIQNSEIHIVATVFLCKTDSKDILLSEEHTDYCWIELMDTETTLPSWIRDSVARVR